MILLRARMVSFDPPLPAAGEWADVHWIRRDTWVRLEVVEGDVEPAIELFLRGIPTEATRWAHADWMQVPLLAGREYMLTVEVAAPARQRGTLRAFEPGDFELLP